MSAIFAFAQFDLINNLSFFVLHNINIYITGIFKSCKEFIRKSSDGTVFKTLRS
jgi:hypothetical protein